MEFGVPVRNSAQTKEKVTDIERVQKSFLYIVLENDYLDYDNALAKVGLDSLEDRRLQLCTSFAKNAAKDPKHKIWFVEHKQSGVETQSVKSKYKTPLHRLNRFGKSPIPYLTGLLNNALS